jgi:protein gp37
MNKTAINWTKLTWNPMSGCTELSEGCKYCYAKTLAENKRGTKAFPGGFDLTIRPHKLREPYRLKEPSLIFVNSMSDLFWDAVPEDYRNQIIDVIADTPQHTYQVLTKRPEAMLEYSKRRKLPANFWAGTTIESLRVMNRLDIVRQVDVPVHFISAEPLLSSLTNHPFGHIDLTGIQWVITGGESGLHLNKPEICKRRGLSAKAFGQWVPRPDRIDWIRQIRDACISQDVAFWHKQWGGIRPHSAGRDLDGMTWDEIPTLAHKWPKNASSSAQNHSNNRENSQSDNQQMLLLPA